MFHSKSIFHMGPDCGRNVISGSFSAIEMTDCGTIALGKLVGEAMYF